MREKRKYQRVTVSLPAVCQAEDASRPAFPVQIVDIGAEGVCFVARAQFAAGQQLRLNIHLSSGNSVTIKAQVAWHETVPLSGQAKVGMKIIDISSDDEERWIQFYCQKLFALAPGHRKILIVTDAADGLNWLKRELEASGYQVASSSDEEKGYFRYLKERPDLLILDLAVPQANGVELCRRIRREAGDAQTPIVILTSNKDDVARIEGRLIGVTLFIPKPCEVKSLLCSVQKIFGRRY